MVDQGAYAVPSVGRYHLVVCITWLQRDASGVLLSWCSRPDGPAEVAEWDAFQHNQVASSTRIHLLPALAHRDLSIERLESVQGKLISSPCLVSPLLAFSHSFSRGPLL